MGVLNKLSIKSKLNFLVGTACGAALLLSTGAFVGNGIYSLRASKVQQVSALAKVVGSNSITALRFDDADAAREVLSSLGLQPTVQLACLYNAKGQLFATYHAAGAYIDAPPAPPADEGHEFLGGRLVVMERLRHDGERVGTIYIRTGMSDLYDQVFRHIAIATAALLVSLGVAVLLSFRLQRVVSGPIARLAETAQRISSARDYSLRVQKEADDELGTLYDEFNAMLDQIQRGERELREAHDKLELRVENRTRELSDANRELSKEVAERKRAEQSLEEVHRQLLDAVRKAGMAEIATDVLHNVGNVLNSINVSISLLTGRVRGWKIAEAVRAIELMDQHQADLGRFLSENQQGKQIPRSCAWYARA